MQSNHIRRVQELPDELQNSSWNEYFYCIKHFNAFWLEERTQPCVGVVLVKHIYYLVNLAAGTDRFIGLSTPAQCTDVISDVAFTPCRQEYIGCVQAKPQTKLHV
jgi:hypothetical protein